MSQSQQTEFDPKAHGLLELYGDEACFEIRKRVIEDQLAFNVKLPTYMDMICRVLAKKGTPEDWLKRLIPQTIRKLMLSEGKQHYQVWACLHFYLIDIHGPIDIQPSITDADILGQSLTRFADTHAPDGAYGNHEYSRDEILTITEATAKGYAYATLETSITGSDPFDVEMTSRYEGIAVSHAFDDNETVKLFLRDVESRALCLRSITYKKEITVGR